MHPMGLNHMTLPKASTDAVFDTAQALGCVGVELRNDLARALFDEKNPSDIRKEAEQRDLRILALAEVYGFNDNSEQTQSAAQRLADLARESGAEAIALIPRIADHPIERQEQRALLRASLETLKPMLEAHGIAALVEPLGFANSSLRFKEDAVAVLNDMGRPACFALIHDTFHHCLSGETSYFADLTRLVHISGVSDPHVAPSDMTDAHRGLVDAHDRLDTIGQIADLRRQGYAGPLSFEAFSPDIHKMTDPTEALLASTAFINSQVAAMAA